MISKAIFILFLTAEIIMLEGLTCVYKSNVDLYFYVIGSSQENEVSRLQFLLLLSLPLFKMWLVMTLHSFLYLLLSTFCFCGTCSAIQTYQLHFLPLICPLRIKFSRFSFLICPQSVNCLFLNGSTIFFCISYS